MKSTLLPAFLPAFFLFFLTVPSLAQGASAVQAARPSIPAAESAAGRIAGAVKDPSGAAVAGARIEIRGLTNTLRRSLSADAEGRFAAGEVPDGVYQVTIRAAGFEPAVLPGLTIRPGAEANASVALKLPRVVAEVEVEAAESETTGASRVAVDAEEQARSRNTAEIAAGAPGVSLRDNGQLASIPLLHGLGDERAKVVVDGVTVSSSCPNHMNPPLSYTAPAHAAQVTVIAGITPVSLGGDSLGGTISVESQPPVFAADAEKIHAEGNSTGFYRSNGNNAGGSVAAWVAGRNLGVGYNGSWAASDDYTDGAGHKVTSTYSQSTDHSLTLAAQGRGNLLIVEAGLHRTPYEGFPGAQMDLTGNTAESVNVRYRRGLKEQGALDGRIFWQNARHAMNIGHDKARFPMPMDMPMNTHGRDLGYSLHLELPLSVRNTLRAGNELHRFALDDTWPAVPGTAPYMGPDTFVNLNNGRRVRVGTFAELASRWSPQWSTLLGLRNDTVWMDAGTVQGYSMMYAADAMAFNAAHRAHTDAAIDLTATARYAPSPAASIEFGYARKTRAPNLYERYAWSTSWMISGMIGWFGDGNYYVGNVSLKPETANTVSGTVALHSGGQRRWEAKLTPYSTRIQDFIDVDTLDTTMYGMSSFAKLRFANHDARIYGADLSASGALWEGGRLGKGSLSGVGGWLRGERLDTHTGLYQMMPLNGRVTLDEELKGFSASLGVETVGRKGHLDPSRFEQATAGYALFNLRLGYRHGPVEASAGADNLLNRNYALPLGGVNFDDFMAGMWMGPIKPLTGRGRSVSIRLTARF